MLAAIPPPALPGSGSRVESLRLSSQPGNTELPVPFILYLVHKYIRKPTLVKIILIA